MNNNISKNIYIISNEDLVKMLYMAYKDAMNKNSFEPKIIINEVLQ